MHGRWWGGVFLHMVSVVRLCTGFDMYVYDIV